MSILNEGIEIEPSHMMEISIARNINSVFDIMEKLVQEREEVLLAILSAGVPASCISLEGPDREFKWDEGETYSLGFRFICGV